ncbi:tetratricopeptide repeat protein [Nostoc sp. 2RC]|uniref:tetratricopeptide repeat protein n=1 Tax=Nostoc sp. 2RC TaxID=2485484 RepID=UPI001626D029|nr:tetratricopeptide repeat protein [Nostoc sp. 2RC]MBC1238342.1 tetratricopeptide repeat protein [Nostoc sp. 2RC]
MSSNESYSISTEKAALVAQGSPVNIQNMTNNILGLSSVNSQPTDFPMNVPFPNATEFIGREEEVKIIHEQLMQSYVPIALYGTGGIGKTELAIQYARQYQESYEGGICWLPARDIDVAKSILNFARSLLGIDPPKDLDVRNQLEYCWSRWREGKVLIVFDDVNNFDRIQNYLPQRSRFKVLITTRLTYGLSRIKFLEIPFLNESVAVKLLRASLRGEDKRIDEEMDYAKKLCKWLDYLPLGLELVGRYLDRKQDLSILEMQKRLEKEKLAQEAINSITAAFELSWQELSEDAKQLGYLLSLFALAPIPWWMVENLQLEQKPSNVEKLRDDWLMKFSLLQRQEIGLYQFHHLVREFIKKKCDEFNSANDFKKDFCGAMVNFINQLLSGEAPDAAETTPPMFVITHIEEIATTFSYLMDGSQIVMSHTWLLLIYSYLGIYAQAAYWGEQCQEEMTRRDIREDIASLWNRYELSHIYLRQGNFRKAEKYLIELLQQAKDAFDEEDAKAAFQAHVSSDLGKLLATQGHFENAENYCRESLIIMEEIVAKQDRQLTPNLSLDLVPSLSALADVYRIRGKYKDSEKLYERLFALGDFESGEHEKYLQQHPVIIIDTFIKFSTLYLEQGLTDAAEEFCEQAQGIVENTFGDEHPIYAICLSNLAQVYLAQGRHQEAEEICQKAIEINKSKDNTGHPTHAINLMNLGSIYTAQGRHEEAEILYTEALEIQERIYGQEHTDVAESLLRLAVNYLERGSDDQAEKKSNLTKAQENLKKAEKMYKSVLGTSHPRYGELLCVLADVSFFQKDYEKTENLYREAIQIFEQTLGDSHPKLGEKLSVLAGFLVSQNRKEDAKPLYQKSLAVAEEVFGKDNPNVCEYMLEIAELNRSLGHEEEAESMYAQAIGIYSKDKSINPDFSEGLMRLIELYKSQRRDDEVVALYKRLLEVSRRLLGNEHPNIVNILSKLAKYLAEQKSYLEAAGFHEDELKIRKSIFNEKHPSIANNMGNLAHVYELLTRFDEAEELYRQALEINTIAYGDSHKKVVMIQRALVQIDNYKKLSNSNKKEPSYPNPEYTTSDASNSEASPREQPVNNEATVPSQEIKEQSTEVENKLSEKEKLEEQNAQMENDLKNLTQQNNQLKEKMQELEEQQKLFEAQIENYQQKNLAHESVLETAAKELIRLTQEECAKLSELLVVVLNDLEQERKNYKQKWDELQTAIEKFNKYGEETDEIYCHLRTHYQADDVLSQNLPLDRKKVDSVIEKVRQLLAELDKELSHARTVHEEAKKRSIYTF